MLVSLLLALPAPRAHAEALLVFAAASLKNALDEAVSVHEVETGHSTLVSYAGSSLLARQLEQGAPADVFISADVAWMDRLTTVQVIDPATRVNLLGNELVLIAPEAEAVAFDLESESDRQSLTDKLSDGRLAVAYVNAVPAGRYGRAALEHLGLWEALEQRLAQTDNVRTTLALVAAGEAPFGIVYATDAAVESRVDIVARFPSESHAPIVYPAAALQGHGGELAQSFLEFLRSPAALEIFERHGFRVAVE